MKNTSQEPPHSLSKYKEDGESESGPKVDDEAHDANSNHRMRNLSIRGWILRKRRAI